jgi:hypothetical protein
LIIHQGRKKAITRKVGGFFYLASPNPDPYVMKIFLSALFFYVAVLLIPFASQAQCSPPITNVPILKGPTSVSTGSSYNFCLGNTVLGLYYFWSVSDGTLSNSVPATSKTITWSTAGNKTITVTPRDLCGNVGPATVFTINVMNQAALAMPTSVTGSVNVCQNTTVQYSVPAVAGMTPVWYVCYEPLVTIEPTLAPSGNTVNITWASPGSYTLYVSYSNGTYSGPANGLAITVTPLILGTASVTGQSQACLNTNTVFTGSASGADAYSWTLSDGGTITPNGSQATINWNKTGGPYQITLTASNGCTGTTQTAAFNVTVGPAQPATPTITSSSTQFCLNSIVTFTAPAGASSYTWTKTEPSGIASTLTTTANTYSPTLYTEGGYMIKVTQSNGACSSSAGTYTFSVPPRPTAYVTLPGKYACINTEYILTAPDYLGHTYSWQIGDGTIIGDNDKSTVHVSWSSIGQKTIYVVITSPCGTPSLPPMSFPEFYVQSSSISLADIKGTTNVCTGSYNYSISAGINASLAAWEIIPSSGGVITVTPPPSGVFNLIASINWTMPGIYTLKATVTNQCGGSSIKTTTVTVNTGTKPNDVTLTLPSTACTNTPYILSVPVQSGTSYAWSTPDEPLIPSGNSATVTWTTSSAKSVSVTPYNGSCQGNTATAGTYAWPKSVAGTVSISSSQVCTNASVGINITGGSTSVSWQYRINGGSWVGLPNFANQDSFIYPVSSGTTTSSLYEFQAIVGGSSACGNAYSNIVAVSVFPYPVVTATIAAATICSQESASVALTSNIPNTTFNWTVNAPSNMSGYSAGTGSSIQQILTNSLTSLSGVTYRITGTANGCTRGYTDASINVNPRPSVTNTDLQQSICNNSRTIFSPSVLPYSSTFIWTSASSTGVTGATTSGTGNIDNTLSNSGSTDGTVTYTIVPTYAGCVGSSTNYVVTVKPTIPIVASGKTLCSAENTNLILGPSGNTFSWNYKSAYAVYGQPTSGSGGAINYNLYNDTNAPGYLIYTVSSIIDGCPALPVDVTFTVNPRPKVDNTNSRIDVCSGQVASFTPTSPVAGTTFTYTATSTSSNISGYSNGTGAINQTLFNSGSTDEFVTYSITPTANGCTGLSSATLSFYVRPAATTPAIASKTICSGQSTAISLPSGNYSWIVKNATNVSGGSAGTGNPINQILTATTPTPGTITYSVSLLNTGICPSIPTDVTITVNPVPVMTVPNITASTTICSGETVNLTPQADVPGSTFSYNASPSSGIVSGYSSGSGNISQTLTSQSPNGGVTYTIKPKVNGCTGAAASYVVLIQSKITATVTGATCATTSSILRAETPTTGVNYLWSTGATTATITATVSGTYSVTISKTGYCYGTANRTVTVYSSESIAQSDDFCNWHPITLTAPAGTSYTWSTGETTRVITPIYYGIYSVSVVFASGCTKSFSIELGACARVASALATPVVSGSEAKVVTLPAASAPILSESFDLRIQDNPFKETLSLLIESPDEPQAVVRLTDLTGKVIHESSQPTNTPLEITPQVPSQVLLLSVRTARNQVVKRVVKMK